MLVEMIDFGLVKRPERAHPMGDVGNDVFTRTEATIPAHTTMRIPLGFGLKLPAGTMAVVMNRSGVSLKGLHCSNAPVDPGYRGEIHAIVENLTNEDITLEAGFKIAQIVLVPVIIPQFVTPAEISEMAVRGTQGFGSSGFY